MSKNESSSKSIFKFLFPGLIIAVLALTLLRVVLANVLATSGERLSAANHKIESLQEENRQLENRLNSSKSLVRLDEFAKEAGLVKAVNVEILIPNAPLASK